MVKVSCIMEHNAELRKSIAKASFQAAVAFVIKSRRNSSAYLADEYIELSQLKAKRARCGEEPKPVYNLYTKEYVWPKMKYVHYYYKEDLTHCCTK